jgi:hypothetical protein
MGEGHGSGGQAPTHDPKIGMSWAPPASAAVVTATRRQPPGGHSQRSDCGASPTWILSIKQGLRLRATLPPRIRRWHDESTDLG